MTYEGEAPLACVRAVANLTSLFENRPNVLLEADGCLRR